MRRLWCRVLDRPALGIDDNFFDLGGSSLTAVRLQALVRAELGIAASPLLVFERSTVRRMAQALAPDSDPAGMRAEVPRGMTAGDARSRRKAARVGIDALSRRVRPS
ncbi:phosphopantetheine-binding protein [Streptomyces lasalocidi]